MDLIKRLGAIVGIFVLCLLIRTLVSPPIVIVGRTAENLKAFLCQSDWWDHSFTILEFLFLLWGIRLCIMVRKAPSEFNESRFISMTIYNEFLLSIFLNVSMFFLQHPANPDLLYIIFFCHSQLTITILLCLIFASKFYLVMKGHGKGDDASRCNGPGKFVAAKVRAAHASLSQSVATGGNNNNNNSGGGGGTGTASPFVLGPNGVLLTGNSTVGQTNLTDREIQSELDKIFHALTMLKERQTCTSTASTASTVATRIAAIQDAFLSTNRGPNSTNNTINNHNHSQEKRVSVYQQQNGRLVNGDQKDDDDDVPTAAEEGGVAKGLAQLGLGGAMMVAETAALAAATMTNHCQAENKRASLIEKISQHQEQEEREPLNVDVVDSGAVNRRRSSYSGSQRSCASSCCCSSSACSYCSRRCSYVSSSNFDGDESSTAAIRQISCDGTNSRKFVRKRSANCQTDPISPPPFLEDDAFICEENDTILQPSVAPGTSECQHSSTDYVEMDAAALLAAASPPITPSVDLQRPPSLRRAKISSISPPPPPPPIIEPTDQHLPSPNHPPPPPVPKRGTKKKKNAHKIIINLDDKDKFTEEVTV